MADNSERTCTYDPLIELMARFESVRATNTSADPFEGLGPEDTLKKHIVDGIKKNLERHLDDALATYPPLAIINDILLDGMKTVGELFGAGKMQLPFVLQSAEVMKAAVRYLEPMMEKVEGSEKGSILLATVAGDVHDIGKNLVDIILSNNGYRVVNIGIKQPVNTILDQCREHQCQVIGLSGLLVKSTLIMRDNLLEMNQRGVSHIPVILGGAALTRSYVEEDLRALYQGSVFYAKDAFEGLALMEQLSTSPPSPGGRGAGGRGLSAPEPDNPTPEDATSPPSPGGRGAGGRGLSAPDSNNPTPEEATSPPSPGGRGAGGRGLSAPRPDDPAPEDATSPREEGAEPQSEAPARTTSHRTDPLDPELFRFTGVYSDIVPVAPPELPFYGARKFARFDLFELYKYINPVALFRGQWQFKRPEGLSNPEFAAWLEETARPIFARMQRELSKILKPQVKWGYFPCAGIKNDLIIYQDDARTERLRFTFPRQRDGRRLCLADYFNRPGPKGEATDVAGFHIVTVGEEVSKHERALFAKGDFQDYLYVHGMGVETAEALAEYWHLQIRRELGIADQEPDDMRLLFSARYHGARYSFGYPACPNLEDQAKLMELLKPEDIGISLSEEFMLVPEQSTSAIIVHHPAAGYFNIR